MPKVKANGLEIEVERSGPPSGNPIVLVRGLGSQLVHWPAGLVAGLVANGFQVIAFDNRDAGLSQKMRDTAAIASGDSGRKAPEEASVAASYTLRDMAADTIGVLDALGLDSVHLLGISMGGMILQTIAIHFPERVRSATIVMSSSGAPGLPPATPEVRALLTASPARDDRETVVAHWLACDRAWASPLYPFDEASRQKIYRLAYDRCYDPEGVLRQYSAIEADNGRHEGLSAIRVPTLVIHGTDDTIFPIEHGRDLAARIPGADLVEVQGMGHDLEGPLPELIVSHVSRLARGPR